MEQQKVFKTELFGFKKKMVLDYLYEVDAKARDSEEELNKKIEQLTNENSELNGKLEEAEAQFQIISAKLSVERENSVQSSQLIGELNQEIEKQRRIISEKDREIQIFSERNNQLLARAEEAEKKLAHFDRLSHRVGDLILEAQHSADGIVSKAQDEADRVTKEAEESAHYVYSEFVHIKDDVLGIKDYTNRMFEEVNLKLAKLEEMLDSQTARFSPEEQLSKIINAKSLREEINFSESEEGAEQPEKPLDKPYIGSFFRGRGISKF